MGVCWIFVNHTRKQFLNPTTVGAGCKKGEMIHNKIFARVFLNWYVEAWDASAHMEMVGDWSDEEWVRIHKEYEDVTLNAMKDFNENAMNDLVYFGVQYGIPQLALPDDYEWHRRERVELIKHMDDTLRRYTLFWYEGVDEAERQQDPEWRIASEIERHAEHHKNYNLDGIKYEARRRG